MISIEREGRVATVTLRRGPRRNALSLALLEALHAGLDEVAASDADAVVVAGEGPVFSAGHDLAEVAGATLEDIHALLDRCTAVMQTLRAMPQVSVARVHGLATAAGCQLVASCDLAVASTEARFALPGGKGGWFCTTPLVAVGRAVGPKRALELGLLGDPIDADTALAWGLVNRVVDPEDLDAAVDELARLATRGSPAARAIGKAAFHHQMGLGEGDAYAYAVEVMAAASQLPDAQEGARAFVEKRSPTWGAAGA